MIWMFQIVLMCTIVSNHWSTYLRDEQARILINMADDLMYFLLPPLLLATTGLSSLGNGMLFLQQTPLTLLWHFLSMSMHAYPSEQYIRIYGLARETSAFRSSSTERIAQKASPLPKALGPSL